MSWVSGKEKMMWYDIGRWSQSIDLNFQNFGLRKKYGVYHLDNKKKTTWQIYDKKM